MNHKNSLQHLIIVGRGFTPVLTALFLQKKWGSLAPRITLVQCGENPDPPIINCVGSIKDVHREIGIAETDFVRKTQTSFHLGTLCQFPNRSEFFMSEAPYGASIHSVRFNHWFVRYLQAGKTARFDDFCINAQLAKRGRFAPPSPKPESVYSQVCYGYTLLSEHYTRYLADQLGAAVSVIRENIENVEIGAEGIKAIRLKNGSSLTADFYIDCTREHGLKRFISSVAAPDTAAQTWTIQDAREHHLGQPHNFLQAASESLTLTAEFRGKIYRQAISCNPAAPSPWLRDPVPWQKNCLSLGPATSNRPALLIDPVHLIASSLYRLYNNWPTDNDLKTPARTYNSSFIDEWDRIADSDSVYLWAATANGEYLTEAAEHRMSVFASDGRIPPYENETLLEDQWAALFFALGITPEVADPLTLGMNDDWIVGQLERLNQALQGAAEHAPKMDAFYRDQVLR
ncbi:MAG: tryptophan 7-halogenase [Cellvibrionaceae bacterium]|nr:tryptophan 7-halogenase [Cellvibrionaceae bacterium]